MSKPIYQGRLIQLLRERISLPNKTAVELEIVDHPGGAVVVALNNESEICLLKQYRHAADQQYIWELPAGCIDAGDATPQLTAQRELLEEAGLRAELWTDLGTIYPSPGFCTEKLFLYLARELQLDSTQHQADELIQVHWRPLQVALNMARTGEINDAKSIVALFRAESFLAKRS